MALLTAGIVVGLAELRARADLDAAMVVTLGIWALYAVVLLLRREGGLRGRRAAMLAARRLRCSSPSCLPITHFAS